MASGHILVADDDFVFRSGSMSNLLSAAHAAELDLVQPAHTELSHRGNPITVRRPFSVARNTTYVENGPVFAVGRALITNVFPFAAALRVITSSYPFRAHSERRGRAGCDCRHG